MAVQYASPIQSNNPTKKALNGTHRMFAGMQRSMGSVIVGAGCNIENPTRDALVFDEDTWNLRRRIVADQTYDAPQAAHGEAFVDGAWKYLGMALDDSYEDGKHYVSESTRWNHKKQERKEQLMKAYATKEPVTMPYTIVTGADTITTIEVEITPEYAGEIFDVAWKVVEDSLDDQTAVETAYDQDSAMWAQNGTVLINPDQYGSSRVDIRVAESVDGFWMTLHELFHLQTASMANLLKQAKEKYMTAAGSSTAIEETPSQSTISEDFPRQHQGAEATETDIGFESRTVDGSTTDTKLTNPGPVVSALNVLRRGWGLPIRADYGESGKVRFFEYKEGNKLPTRLVGLSNGVSKNNSEEANKLHALSSSRALPDPHNMLSHWHKRFQNVEVNVDPSNLYYRKQSFTSAQELLISSGMLVDTLEDSNSGRSFTYDSQLQLTSTTFEYPNDTAKLPRLNLSKLNLRFEEATVDGITKNVTGHGELYEVNPFYRYVPVDGTPGYAVDAGQLEGGYTVWPTAGGTTTLGSLSMTFKDPWIWKLIDYPTDETQGLTGVLVEPDEVPPEVRSAVESGGE